VILMAWAVILLCVLLLALAFWAIIASDGESGMRDNKPTLDVQNHRGD
jgi:hypothetical protein